MRAPPSLTFLVVAFLVAGCVDSGSAPGVGSRKGAGTAKLPGEASFIPTDWYEIALPTGAEHNHRNASQHRNLSTANFQILGYDPLITDYYGKTAGDYFCGDQKERDGRRLSVVASWGSDVAFVLADTTDPAHPFKVGELAMANTQVYDVALTPDMDYVVLSTSPFDSGPDAPPAPVAPWGVWHDECTGIDRAIAGPESSLPFSSGVVLVDITNPHNPLVVDFRQLPVIGSHSVRANDAAGTTFITVSVDNGASTASYYVFFEIQKTLAGAKLLPLSVYAYVPETAERAQPTVGVHMDGLVAIHPVTHQRLAYLAFRGVGMVIVDLTDPARPVFLSDFRPFPLTAHSVMPLPDVWDGRHYTIVGEECGGPSRGNPSCLIILVDDTDPRDPRFVSAWTLPALVDWREGLEFSMHYFDVFQRTLFVSTYHGGVWAIDLSSAAAVKTMPTIGVFVPALTSPKGFDTPPRSPAGSALLNVVANAPLADHPVVMDVVASSDGVLTLWDAQSGLYTVRFDASDPAPPPPLEVKGVPRSAD